MTSLGPLDKEGLDNLELNLTPISRNPTRPSKSR